MNKAGFVRTRLLTESVDDVIAAAQKAGIHGMTRQDIYTARKVAANRAALMKVRDALGGRPTNGASEEKEEPKEEPVPRRKRMPRVPTPGSVIHKVHTWLAHYVRVHGRGPPTMAAVAAVAAGVSIPVAHANTYVAVLRKSKMIDYEYRDLRTMQILREPLPSPSEPKSERTNGAPTRLPPEPSDSERVLEQGAKAVAGNPYLHQLDADLTRILGRMALRGVQTGDASLLTQVAAKVTAMRELLTLLAEDAAT